MIHPVLDWLKSLHNPDTFAQWLSTGGVMVITAIIFAETGLLFGFFLPGDSLIITTGVLCNPANPNHLPGLSIFSFQVLLVVAAIVGDQLGYFLGFKTGALVAARPDGLFFKKRYLENAHLFYEKYGTAAIVACRFVPIMRTFVPFVAGAARMEYRKFFAWDILGGFLWITSMLWLGYFLGQTGLANRLDKIILLVVFISVIPMGVGALKQILKTKEIKSS
jgi:membrane-associated protein